MVGSHLAAGHDLATKVERIAPLSGSLEYSSPQHVGTIIVGLDQLRLITTPAVASQWFPFLP
jgi:hypothetical protein